MCTGKRPLLPSNDLFLQPWSALAVRERAKAPDTVSLAEFGSFTLEWHALSARTGNPGYAVLADHFIDNMAQRYPKQARTSLWVLPHNLAPIIEHTERFKTSKSH